MKPFIFGVAACFLASACNSKPQFDSSKPYVINSPNMKDYESIKDLPPPQDKTKFDWSKYPTIIAGRYQLVQLGTMRRDQFLLDTVDGRVWNKGCIGTLSNHGLDCSEDAWVEQSKINK